MFTARTKRKDRPAVAALLQSLTIGALMLCSSAPVFAIATFDAAALIYVEVAFEPPESVDVDIPSDATLTVTVASKWPADADAASEAKAVADATYDGDAEDDGSVGILSLYASAEVGGSAASGSASAYAFGSALAYLSNLTEEKLDITILINEALLATAITTESAREFASAAAGWSVDLFLGDDLVDLTQIIEGENLIGWTATLLPVGEDINVYTLRVSASAEGSAAVPEPATLALFGLGLAGIGAVRRRKLAA